MATDPGYALEVRPWPAYGCCVVRDTIDGQMYIPVDRMGQSVVMIGYGRGTTWNVSRRGVHREDVTFHLFSADVLVGRMEPVGPLHDAIVCGVKIDDDSRSRPLCAPPFDPARPTFYDQHISPTSFALRPFRAAELVAGARQRAYSSDPRLEPSLIIATAPLLWYWFVGWMHEHRAIGDPRCRRVGVHFRWVGTPVTAANLKWKNLNWVDRRLA